MIFFFFCEKTVCAVYNLGPSLAPLRGGRPVIRRASSLWVMEFIVETTLEVPQKCGHKTNSAHQYLPAALWPQQMKMNERTFLLYLKTSLGENSCAE